ncbi:MAG: ATP-dependent helicase [Caulobacterales bacterium]|jgi:DNA helicase-2/ATP-dependent DNA helicase PcrA
MAENLPISRRAMALPPYLEGLNQEQRAAVEALDGPVLVLSGAGTGKTRVLTTRLAHLLSTGRAKPWQILAVTFTNKASREMRHRVEQLLGPGGGGIPWLGTFHSISAQMLRRHAELVGLKSNFTILDTDDQLRLLKQVIEADGIDEKRFTARALAGVIDSWKNRALKPERVTAKEAHAWGEGKSIDMYRAYQDRLKILNACDFGDLLLHMITIFQENPDLLADYHKKLTYVMVDEYQDTNVAQYLWLRLLAQSSHNICVVGDDDQSIYGWRGAEVDNILRFERDFPGATVVRLEQNYRSTANILAAAAAVISNNRQRLGKTLRTDAAEGERVKVRGVWDGEAEARLVADEIEAWTKRPATLLDPPKRPYASAAVLVRAAWQMRAFEERFLMLKIPYKVIGGPRFFERAEVRDAHAYLKLIVSEDNDLAFERVVNQPKRGVGDSSVAKLAAIARAMGVAMLRAARETIGTDEIKGAARTGLRTFIDDLDRWRRLAQDKSHVELAETILDESGYTAMLQADKSPQAQTRLENLKELVQAMGQFDTLEAYLEHVSLVLDIDAGGDGDEVHLSTLHAAKGLEWPLVFLPGWEETVFPSQRSIDEGGEKSLEEERRLAYVGITRARERAIITFAASRQIYGRWQSVIPSRFVDELPEANVDATSETGYAQAASLPPSGAGGVRDGWARFDTNGQGASFNSGYSSPGWKRAQDRGGFSGNRAPIIDAEAKLVAKSGTQDGSFRKGQMVLHEKFGRGVIRMVEGNKLVVIFEMGGEKRVIDSFVKAAG